MAASSLTSSSISKSNLLIKSLTGELEFSTLCVGRPNLAGITASLPNANGKGMLVQAGKVADVEEGIAKNRKVWMGAEMLELFRGGRSAPLFPNKL